MEFYLKLLDCLLTVLTRLNYTSCFGEPVAYFKLQFRTNKQPKFGQFYTTAEITWKMIGSTLTEKKASALFLFSSIETGLFRLERALPTPGQRH